MEERKNPFKVPEDYFENLNKRLAESSKQKHVSSPRMFRYVASFATAVVLGLSAWLVLSPSDRLSLRETEAFTFFSDKKEREEARKIEEAKAQQLAWQKQKAELQEQAEEIVFSEEEIEYLNCISVDKDFDLLLQEEDIEL